MRKHFTERFKTKLVSSSAVKMMIEAIQTDELQFHYIFMCIT